MNRSILFAVSLLLSSSTGILFAATATPTTPKIAANSTAASPANNNPNPNTHQINQQLQAQFKEIEQGIKSGKITKEQGATFRASLKSIRAQETAFFKKNGNHELTSAQESQLNQSLATNAQTLTAAGLSPVTTSLR